MNIVDIFFAFVAVDCGGFVHVGVKQKRSKFIVSENKFKTVFYNFDSRKSLTIKEYRETVTVLVAIFSFAFLYIHYQFI